MVSLVCLPHAGGGLGRFRKWREELPDGVRLVLPELPGREGRIGDDPFPDVASMSRHLVRALTQEIEQGHSLMIAGISYGALVAFDLAARLEESGSGVAALFVASQRAPATPLPALDWRLLDDRRLLAELVAMGGLSPDLGADEEFRELFLPVIRAELHASETYRRPAAARRLRCPIFLYHGVDDATIPAASTHAWCEETPHFSWRALPAAHFLLGPDGADLWWEALRKDLALFMSGADSRHPSVGQRS
ncbi:thioesterase II family protein [Nonomuraea gerenzanensis]|uniref:Thioesterase in siderophore biosynthesis gene cluster n=1 Tax=Nonomuraea gerenzanensis TaxID=93944 RepID=A0A1M4EFS0_9ACTN|nr:alpha/beta fold hydrolase [Nonomuraea gerenzanensis]UBU09320.1 alpha/beta fold hydrolase [Nonomuraea gerenzanensis]SBO97729.1 Thioesterase in siderophore biosynthesis gene cluster [Nonomuraea gerenzanensis]